MKIFGGREKWREAQGSYDGLAKYKKFPVVLSAFIEQVLQTDTHWGYCSSQAAVNWHDLHPDQVTLVEGHRNQAHIHNKLSRHLPVESCHWAAVSLVGMLDIVLVIVLEVTSLFIMKTGFPKQILIPTTGTCLLWGRPHNSTGGGRRGATLCAPGEHCWVGCQACPEVAQVKLILLQWAGQEPWC